MLIYKQGNLFSTDDLIIAHGCNSHGVMGSGVAKIVREMYPAAYRKYITEPKDLGTNIIEFTENKFIVNMITQENFGPPPFRYVSYDAISTCFASLFNWMKHTQYINVSIPLIGAGLGGGDWKVIEAIILSELKKYDITVNVWQI